MSRNCLNGRPGPVWNEKICELRCQRSFVRERKAETQANSTVEMQQKVEREKLLQTHTPKLLSCIAEVHIVDF